MTEFHHVTPTLENYWRSVILFGRNVASYKFALGHALLDLGSSVGDFVKLEDLAKPYATHLARHIKEVDVQSTSRSSKFLDTIRDYNLATVDESQLIDRTVKLGFSNVIDAFHVVNGADIPKRFFVDERKSNGGIRLTDTFFELVHKNQIVDLPKEVEARWRLVETAWSLKISRNLLTVHYDAETNGILYTNHQKRRTNVTSCRHALNGYQKGRCFYCFDDISVVSGHENLAEVDHFFPHVLKGYNLGRPIDGIWNLVLACRTCNAGRGGKHARIPKASLLNRLHKRNEYLIRSERPLRETLIRQTGDSPSKRRQFLQAMHTDAVSHLIHTWCPEPKQDPTF